MKNEPTKYFCKHCGTFFFNTMPEWQEKYLINRCPNCLYMGHYKKVMEVDSLGRRKIRK